MQKQHWFLFSIFNHSQNRFLYFVEPKWNTRLIFFTTNQDWQIPFQRCPEMKHSLFMSNAYFELRWSLQNYSDTRYLLEIGISFCQHGICFFQSEILHSFNFPKRNFFYSYFMLPKIWKICVYEPISKFFWDLIPP